MVEYHGTAIIKDSLVWSTHKERKYLTYIDLQLCTTFANKRGESFAVIPF